jgi:hypothetical protein
MPLGRAQRMGLSGDYGDLISLTLNYSGGNSVKFNRQWIDRLKAAAGVSKGVWWINESGIEYISGRDANIRQRRLTGGKL